MGCRGPRLRGSSASSLRCLCQTYANDLRKSSPTLNANRPDGSDWVVSRRPRIVGISQVSLEVSHEDTRPYGNTSPNVHWHWHRVVAWICRFDNLDSAGGGAPMVLADLLRWFCRRHPGN